MAMGVMEPAMHAALLNSAVLAAACWLSSARGGGAQGLAWAFVLASYVSTGALVWTSWGLKVSLGCVVLEAISDDDDC